MVFASVANRCLHIGDDCDPDSCASAIFGSGVFLMIGGGGSGAATGAGIGVGATGTCGGARDNKDG